MLNGPFKMEQQNFYENLFAQQHNMAVGTTAIYLRLYTSDYNKCSSLKQLICDSI